MTNRIRSSRAGRSLSVRLASVVLAALALLILSPQVGHAQSDAGPQMKVVHPQDIKALIAANKGKVVFLNFFATYCVPCHTEFPDIVKLQDKYKGQLQVIEVSMNDVTDPSDVAEMKKYIEQTKPSFPVYIASSVDDDFYKGVDARWAKDGEALPMTTIFDKDGKEVHYYEKALNLQLMEADVKPLLSASGD